jgi:hypothetical protein
MAQSEIGELDRPGSWISDLQRYYDLPIWKGYLKARKVWAAAHLTYCNTFLTDPLKAETRVAMQEAQSAKDALLPACE